MANIIKLRKRQIVTGIRSCGYFIYIPYCYQLQITVCRRDNDIKGNIAMSYSEINAILNSNATSK